MNRLYPSTVALLLPLAFACGGMEQTRTADESLAASKASKPSAFAKAQVTKILSAVELDAANSGQGLSHDFACETGTVTASGSLQPATLSLDFVNCANADAVVLNGTIGLVLESASSTAAEASVTLDLVIAQGDSSLSLVFAGSLYADAAGQTIEGTGTVLAAGIAYDLAVVGLHHAPSTCYPDAGTVTFVEHRTPPRGDPYTITTELTFDSATATSGQYETCTTVGDLDPVCEDKTLNWSCEEPA